MKRWLGIGLMGAALLIAACGGDDALSVEQYFDRFQTIAADQQAPRDTLPEPESFEEFADLFDRQADILDDSLDKVTDLDPPDEVKPAHGLFIETLEDFAKSARDLAGELEDVEDEDDFFEVLAAADLEIVAATFQAACGGLEAIAAANSITVDLECGD